MLTCVSNNTIILTHNRIIYVMGNKLLCNHNTKFFLNLSHLHTFYELYILYNNFNNTINIIFSLYIELHK